MTKLPPTVFSAVPAPRKASFQVRDVPDGVASARAFIRGHCRDAGFSDDLCDTAMLLTSEAVTNALVYAGPRASVIATAVPGGLLVEIEDAVPGPLLAGPLPHPDPRALGGRGLFILAELATEWGSYDRGRGKVVWFALKVSRAVDQRR